ncbi:MAG: tRNA (guanosine(37)-N1)-methyltransferase TrmD [Desulfobacterales bacterium]|nr:tRNA (guanosine(37)-N1)-methyltransferase TrmD [Desulfobacterales bacterium]
MHFSVLTIFPDMFDSFWEHGIIRKAVEEKKIFPRTVNIRDFTRDRHNTTDDRPYGGGCGMVMKPEPAAEAIRFASGRLPDARKILLTPQGRVFNQRIASELAASPGLILVCGRYEGMDERICQDFIDDEISTGDYVLTGGELPAMVIIDAVARLLPGVLGGAESAEKDSFADGLLEHAHYTRPPVFNAEPVPAVLTSGNHAAIDRWRMESALIRTFLKRPDLLENRSLSKEETEILKKWRQDIERIINAQSSPGPAPLSGGQ